MTINALTRLAAVLVLACNCLWAVAATAQQPTPSTIAAARDMLAAKGGMAFFDSVIPGVVESIKNSFIPTNPQLSGELNEVSAMLRKEYDAKRSEMQNEIAKVFAEHFTEKELKELTAFYKTPLGQKLVKEEPVAVQESVQNAKAWTDQFGETVMTRFRAEMRKKGHPL
jgi:hypothetical protein